MDAMGVFPCIALLWAGRQLLEARWAEYDVLKHIAQVHRMFKEDVQVNIKFLAAIPLRVSLQGGG